MLKIVPLDPKSVKMFNWIKKKSIEQQAKDFNKSVEKSAERLTKLDLMFKKAKELREAEGYKSQSIHGRFN